MPKKTKSIPAKKSKEKQQSVHIEVMRQMLTLATSGFGLVAALAWNSLIQKSVENYVVKYLPQGSEILSLAIYAIVVTVLAVIITLQLSKMLKKLEEEKK